MSYRTAANHADYLKRKSRTDLPTIPADLAKVIGNNTLTADQEAESDAAIARACRELHDRRAFREDVKRLYELPSYSTTKLGIVRCA